MSWFAYILLCSDGSFYVGHTQDLAQRLAAHNAGKGASYTAARRPVSMAFSEACASHSDAIAREAQIKKWSRAKKLALIDHDKERLHDLAKCHAQQIPARDTSADA